MRNEIGGQTSGEDRSVAAAGADGAEDKMAVKALLPRRAPNRDGHARVDSQNPHAVSGDGHWSLDPQRPNAIATKSKRRVHLRPDNRPESDATGAGHMPHEDHLLFAGSTSSRPKRKPKGEGRGHALFENRVGHAAPNSSRRKAGNGGGQSLCDNLSTGAPTASICQQLMALQRQRRFLIRTANRQTNAAGAYIRSLLGWRVDMPEAERAKIVKAAAKAVKECVGWEAGSPNTPHPNMTEGDATLVKMTLRMADPAKELRAQVEKSMCKLARQLPVYPWAEQVKGFGDLALAVVVGEAGDLSNYATKERLWKRLGLAVIDGIRQQKRSNVDEAAAHGYNPQRRAEMFAVVCEPLFRHQWSGADEETGEAGKPKGPYGEVYAKRRARTSETHSDWTKAHSHKDALRIMTKELIADLWSAWRAATTGVSPNRSLPPANSSKEAA